MRIIIKRGKKKTDKALAFDAPPTASSTIDTIDTSDTKGSTATTPPPTKQRRKLSKELVVIIALSIILIGLTLFVIWDVWLKNVSYNCQTVSTPVSNSQQSGTAGKTKPNNTNQNSAAVDASLYASCSTNITDEKAYKSCCDALSADDTVKKACKKVVDDANTSTAPSTAPQSQKTP